MKNTRETRTMTKSAGNTTRGNMIALELELQGGDKCGIYVGLGAVRGMESLDRAFEVRAQRIG